MMRIFIIVPTLLTLVFLSVVFVGSLPAAGQDASEALVKAGSTLLLEQQVKTSKDGGTVLLTAKLIAEEGNPINSRTVVFFEVGDFFGPSSVKIGEAKTNAVGTATFTYIPKRAGVHDIEAVFSGDNEYEPVLTDISVNISNAASIESEPVGLDGIGGGTLLMVGLITLTVWFILALTVFKVYRGIAHSSDLGS